MRRFYLAAMLLLISVCAAAPAQDKSASAIASSEKPICHLDAEGALNLKGTNGCYLPPEGLLFRGGTRRSATVVAMKRPRLCALALVFFLLGFAVSPTAHANCANPTGVAGKQMYNTTYHVAQFCDGTNWVAMGLATGSGGAGCSNPAGVERKTTYNTTLHTFQFCNGTNWISMGGTPFSNGSYTGPGDIVAGATAWYGLESRCPRQKWIPAFEGVIQSRKFWTLLGFVSPL